MHRYEKTFIIKIQEKAGYEYENVTILDHPLIQHKISLLRNKNTGTNEFRSLTDEIAMLMGYEALRDLPLEDQEVETPIETCSTPMLLVKNLPLSRFYVPVSVW